MKLGCGFCSDDDGRGVRWLPLSTLTYSDQLSSTRNEGQVRGLSALELSNNDGIHAPISLGSELPAAFRIISLMELPTNPLGS